MPIECERLQGLPDDWTRYGRREDGTTYEMKDGPRYKMIGNGGAVPVVEWIGRRIARNLTA
jgi:DNA (cytosine-5)-methyltransferase 1